LFSRQQQADSNVNDPVAIEVEDEISADGDLDGTSVEGEDAESDYFSPPPTPIAENLIEKPADQLVTTKIPPPYVIISITGWMTKRQQSISIWQHIDTHLNQPDLPLLGDHYSLCWETRALIDLGRAGLMSAMVIPASLMAVMSVMDNPFSVAYSRARKAGQGKLYILWIGKQFSYK
jgi:hypothetical protein